MEIKEVKDKTIWNDFVFKNGEYSAFLHSWQWGEFQENLGRKIWRLGIFENEKLEAAALVIKNNLPLRKSYLYIPRGPLYCNLKLITYNLLKQITSFIKDKSVIFLKVDLLDNLKDINFKLQEAPALQPQHTLVLNLEKSEEELVAEMHEKTRYNIRLAGRKGVKIRFSNESKDFDKFLELIKITSKRDEFIPHAESYYKKMFVSLGDQLLQIALAEYQGKVLAANLIMFFHHTATYLHGASSDEYRNLMASHLLQWEMIKKAKAEGFKNYDFWGIAPEGSEKEKTWSGITRFKRGFGGKEIFYPGTFDISLNNFWYKLYKLAKRIK